MKPQKISENVAEKLFGHYGSNLVSLVRKLISVVIIITTVYYTAHYFNLQVQFSPLRVLSSVAFSKEEFSRAVTMGVYVTTVMGILSLTIEIVHSLIM